MSTAGLEVLGWLQKHPLGHLGTCVSRTSAVAVGRGHLPQAVAAEERHGISASLPQDHDVAPSQPWRLRALGEVVALEAERPRDVDPPEGAGVGGLLRRQPLAVVELQPPLVVARVALPGTYVRPKVDDHYLPLVIVQRLRVFDPRCQPTCFRMHRLAEFRDHLLEGAALRSREERRHLAPQGLRVLAKARELRGVPGFRGVVHRHAAADVQHLDLVPAEVGVDLERELHHAPHARGEDLDAHLAAADVDVDAVQPGVALEGRHDCLLVVNGDAKLGVLRGDGERVDRPRADQRVDPQADVGGRGGQGRADGRDDLELL
mmetsp:Transcript_30048/g.81451  ORF Transcript_30048/g.81451 Transcript_30048/m.81451 type:complete len:319 (+) Transcript_30048:177-1133(+)